jgi:phosphatidylinositol alpha-mannosyltransferase
MRIAMFQNILPEAGRKPGGVSVYVHRLANALAAREHDVVVFTYSPRPAGAGYAVRPLRLPSARSSRVLRQYVAPWLLNLEDLGGFDLAHFHGEDWFFLRRGLPVVRTFHGSALAEARSATSLSRRIDKRVVYGLERLAARRATAAYGVGVDSERVYRTRGRLYPGVELPAAPVSRSPAPSILFVGTWSGRKRGSLLFETFTREVRARVPDAELWMVSDECPAAAPGVRWVQAPDDEELGRLYSQAWLFCMPSSYEGFGIPYLEAMAHWTPTVATPNPGAETILGGGHGLLVAEDELGSALVEMLQSPERRRALARRGRSRAEEFSWDRSAERHEAAYAEAIRATPAAARR